MVDALGSRGWVVEAMKDVLDCDKLGGAVKKL